MRNSIIKSVLTPVFPISQTSFSIKLDLVVLSNMFEPIYIL